MAEKVDNKANGDDSPAQTSIDDFNFFKRTFQKMETIEEIQSYIMKHMVEFSAEFEKGPQEELLGRLTLDKSFYEYGGTPLKPEAYLKSEELEATNPHERAGWSVTAWDKDYGYSTFKA